MVAAPVTSGAGGRLMESMVAAPVTSGAGDRLLGSVVAAPVTSGAGGRLLVSRGRRRLAPAAVAAVQCSGPVVCVRCGPRHPVGGGRRVRGDGGWGGSGGSVTARTC